MGLNIGNLLFTRRLAIVLCDNRRPSSEPVGLLRHDFLKRILYNWMYAVGCISQGSLDSGQVVVAATAAADGRKVNVAGSMSRGRP